MFGVHLENDTGTKHIVDSLLIPQDTTKHPGMLHCLRCIPAHSQLRLSTKFIANSFSFYTSMQKGIKKNNLSQRLQKKKSRLTCVVLVWCFLSWLCRVKRRAETSISPALLDKPPLPLLSLSLPSSLSLSLSLSQSALSHPAHSSSLLFFFLSLDAFPPSASFSLLRCLSSTCCCF